MRDHLEGLGRAALAVAVLSAACFWAAAGTGMAALRALAPLPGGTGWWLAAAALYGGAVSLRLTVLAPLEAPRGRQVAEILVFLWLARMAGGLSAHTPLWVAALHPLSHASWAVAVQMSLLVLARTSGGAVARALAPALEVRDPREFLRDAAEVRRGLQRALVPPLAAAAAVAAAEGLVPGAGGWPPVAQVLVAAGAAGGLLSLSLLERQVRQARWREEGRRLLGPVGRRYARVSLALSAAAGLLFLLPAPRWALGPQALGWLSRALSRLSWQGPSSLPTGSPPPLPAHPPLLRHLPPLVRRWGPVPSAPHGAIPWWAGVLALGRDLWPLLLLVAVGVLLRGLAVGGRRGRVRRGAEGGDPLVSGPAGPGSPAPGRRGRRDAWAGDAVRRAMRRVLAYAAHRGRGRRPGETVSAFAARVSAGWREEGAAALRALVGRYEEVRYGGRRADGEAGRVAHRLAARVLAAWRREGGGNKAGGEPRVPRPR